jgi:hypothetical protein
MFGKCNFVRTCNSVNSATTPRNRVMLEKANSHSTGQEIPSLLRFITVLTTAHQYSLYVARLIQSVSYQPISLRSILILSFKLSLPFTFLDRNVVCILSSHACYMSRESHPPDLIIVIIFCEKYEV